MIGVIKSMALFPLSLIFIAGIVTLLVLSIKALSKNPKLTLTLILIPVVLIFLIAITRILAPSEKSRMVSLDLSKPDPVVSHVTQYMDNTGIQEFTESPGRSGYIPTVIPSWDTEGNNVATAVNSNINSPIWSEGIEERFEADVYPSGISTLRALAPRVAKQIPYVMGESGSPETIVIYSESDSVDIIEEFRQALSKLIPEVKCRIEIGDVSLKQNELGIRFSLQHSSITTYPYVQRATNVQPYARKKIDSLKTDQESGTIQANIFSGPRQSNVSTKYNNKLWVENFSDYVNRNPNKQFNIAKSNETCITYQEADRQAMINAHDQVKAALSNIINPGVLNSTDILESGIVTDKFMQSFDGSAGKIWREAVLLDLSNQRLHVLADRITRTTKAKSNQWIRIVFSTIGFFIVIIAAYIFLNTATRGYYSWSLRIASFILVVIFLIILSHLSPAINLGF